jgi:hypothetical protein
VSVVMSTVPIVLTASMKPGGLPFHTFCRHLRDTQKPCVAPPYPFGAVEVLRVVRINAGGHRGIEIVGGRRPVVGSAGRCPEAIPGRSSVVRLEEATRID